MKTSNKLLVVGAVLLVTAAVINAFALKSRFATMTAGTSATLRDFHAEGFDAVELSGTAPRGMGLRVTVKRAGHLAVRYTDLDFIHIWQLGTTLKITVDHPKGYTTDIRKRPEIIIECPELIALTAIGTPLDSLDLPADAYAITRQFYRKSSVNIQDFRGDRLRLMAANGMEVTLGNSTIDTLMAVVNPAGKLEIGQNELGHAILKVGDEGTVTLDRAQIGTMSTDVAKKGQLILKGSQLTVHGKSLKQE